jgi:hypothetical protein
MFVHPRCPCTRASLGELEKIIAHCQGKFTPWIVFMKPKHSPSEWEHTDLWQTANAIPGSHVLVDIDGEESRRFGASTSGHTMLYGADGKLLFSGGITSARGHFGDNVGRDAIESWLKDQQVDHSRTPVYGCPIFSNDNVHSIDEPEYADPQNNH